MTELKTLIPHLFHFTDRANLDGIRVHGGILSVAELERRGVEPARPGGNEWSRNADALKGMHAFVHLCLFQKHPMEHCARHDGRIESPVFLRISNRVLDLDGVRITPDVSNKSGVPILQVKEAREQIEFEYLPIKLDFSVPEQLAIRKRLERVEVLVPKVVPLDLIENL